MHRGIRSFRSLFPSQCGRHDEARQEECRASSCELGTIDTRDDFSVEKSLFGHKVGCHQRETHARVLVKPSAVGTGD